MPKLFTSYGLQGEPETRIAREFERVQEEKLDGALEKKYAVPKVKEMKDGWPVLVKTGESWYIYIRIGDAVYKADLTAV